MANYNLTQTGAQVQALLDTVAAGYIYMGVADLTTIPDTTNPNVCYLLKAVGTYTNFGNIQHASGIGIALWNGSAWSYQNVPSSAVVQTDATPTANSTKPVQSGGVFNFVRQEVAEEIENLQPIVIEGNVSNAPDEEDLTSVDQSGTDVLKFKDKAYAPLVFSGLGRKYLRKNIVNGSNILTYAMVSDANTIYHIQYDYDLNGQTITLPAGSTLSFEGGSLSNGTLAGTNTQIHAGIENIFDDSLSVIGSWIVECVYPQWFGAKADGVADDRTAIIKSLDMAVANLPSVVHFPSGDYGISNGIYYTMPNGSCGLTISGDGGNTSRIVYLPEFDPLSSPNWYALQIKPAFEDTATDPYTQSEDDYIHDLTIKNIGVYDPTPYEHALNPDVDNTSGTPHEETHGFGIHFTIRANVIGCLLNQVGDEAIDLEAVHDGIIADNHIYNSPGAGTAGGAISVGDGCKGVIVSNNTIQKTVANREQVTRSNFGINVESLRNPSSDVVIVGNVIRDINGYAICLVASNTGASLKNITISNNIILDCVGGLTASGTYTKESVLISDNQIKGMTGYAVYLQNSTGNTHWKISNCYIENCYKGFILQLGGKSEITHCIFRNISGQAIFCSQGIDINHCKFSYMATETDKTIGVIQAYSAAVVSVSDCDFDNISTSKTLQDITNIINCNISAGGDNVAGTKTKRLIGGNFGGRITIGQPNSIIEGISLVSTNIGSNGITLTTSASYTIISKCYVSINNYQAVKSNGDCDYLTIIDNDFNKTMSLVGSNNYKRNNIINGVRGDV